MVFSALTDGISRSIEGVAASVSGALFEPTLRLGVTGLSRAGKTVFITGLVANLMERGRMPQLRAAAAGRIEAVYLQPQPDLTLPRFDYEAHLAAMTGDDPRWPQSTRAVSELRLSFRTRPSGLFAGFLGPQTLHLDIVDYPGEWLLDLTLIDKTYAEWSEATLDRIAKRPEAADFMATARAELRRSTLLDPRFGLSHGHYALLTIVAANIGLVPDTPELRADVLASAMEAIALDDGSSEVLGYAGCALCDLGHYRHGIDTLQRALDLNPSNAQAHVAMGAALAMNRKLDAGIERMRYGMKISPRDRRLGFWGWLLGRFLLRADRVDEALVEARLSCRADPRFHLPHVLQAASLDRLGASTEAVAALSAARQRRSQLSLDEVTLTHGRRIGERIALLWERAG